MHLLSFALGFSVAIALVCLALYIFLSILGGGAR